MLLTELGRPERSLRGALVALKPKPAGELGFRDLAWTYSEGTPDSCSPIVWTELLFTITDDGAVVLPDF